MKRSALIRRTPLRSGSKTLKRWAKLRPVNPKRAAKKSARNFGPHADFVRQQPCAVPGCTRTVEAAHVTCRGMGGANGGWWDLVPLCSLHHREQEGCLEEFQEAYEIDLRELAVDLVAQDLPRLRQLGVIPQEDAMRIPIGLRHVLAQVLRRLARSACHQPHRYPVLITTREVRFLPYPERSTMSLDPQPPLVINYPVGRVVAVDFEVSGTVETPQLTYVSGPTMEAKTGNSRQDGTGYVVPAATWTGDQVDFVPASADATVTETTVFRYEADGLPGPGVEMVGREIHLVPVALPTIEGSEVQTFDLATYQAASAPAPSTPAPEAQ